MKFWLFVLAAVATLAPLTASTTHAGRSAPKTVLSIRTTVEGNLDPARGTTAGTFLLELGASTDSGKLTRRYTYGALTRTAAGQAYRPGQFTETLRGKAGTLVLRVSGRQFPVGVRHPVVDPDGDSMIWVGTWTIVRGTGRYVGLEGGGGVAGTAGIIPGRGIENAMLDRYEGYVAPRR